MTHYFMYYNTRINTVHIVRVPISKTPSGHTRGLFLFIAIVDQMQYHNVVIKQIIEV